MRTLLPIFYTHTHRKLGKNIIKKLQVKFKSELKTNEFKTNIIETNETDYWICDYGSLIDESETPGEVFAIIPLSRSLEGVELNLEKLGKRSDEKPELKGFWKKDEHDPNTTIIMEYGLEAKSSLSHALIKLLSNNVDQDIYELMKRRKEVR